MKRGRTRIYLCALTAVGLLLLLSNPSFAQCPLCRLALDSSKEGAAMARGLDVAILVLLVPPVTIFCAIFGIAKKSRKAEDDDLDGDSGK